jgi:hypothetical protein
MRQLQLQEAPEIEHAVDDVRILLNNVGECLRIDERDRKLLVKRVIIPIHFRKSHDAGTRIVPTTRARETAYENGGRSRFERCYS